MAEALEKVKRDLGPQAIILHTRTLSKGGLLGVGARIVVEVTASRDAGMLPAGERRARLGQERSALVTEAPARRSAPRRPIPPRQPPSMPMRSAPPAARPPAPIAPQPPAGELSSFADSLKGEMGELRQMVRQLLDRPIGAAAAVAPGEVPEYLREFYTQLISQAVADELAREVIARANLKLDVPRGQRPDPVAIRQIAPTILVECLEQMLPEAQPVQLVPDGSTRYVALVGPTGVGKTTTVAKLAAHFKLREGRRVGLITIDTYRIAAVEQLRAYAEILNVPLEIVFSPADMTAALDRMSHLDLVLIDTSGRSQRDTQRLSDLKTFLDAARTGPDGDNRPRQRPLEVHLVLSCTSSAQQLLEVAESFAVLAPERVLFTKLDEAVGVGVVLSTASRLNLRLSYLTTGQDVPDDIEVGHARRIAQMVLSGGRQDAAPAAASSRGVEHLA